MAAHAAACLHCINGICINQQAKASNQSRVVIVQQKELHEVKAQTEKTKGALTRFLR